MSVLEVGKLYVPGRSQWPEAIEYNYDKNGHTLVLFFLKPSSKEVDAIRKDEVEIAVHIHQNLPFLCARFGNIIPWSDCPFCWWMVPEQQRAIPEKIESGKMAVLNILLVDAANGILKVIRSVSLSNEISSALHDAIIMQIQGEEITAARYAQIAAEMTHRYTSEQLAKIATLKYKVEKKKKGFG